MLKAEFGVAIALLTRVPAGWLSGPSPIDPARATWAFPLVGAGIGAAAGLVVAAGTALGMPAPLAAAWALAAAALLSGALHEDGLADVADGFGGGATRERKLEIMRDSRIGSYGALALVLATAIRVFAIAALAQPITALTAAWALSRGSLAIPLLLPAARAGGLGALVLGAGWRRWACLALALAIAALALPPKAALAAAAAALAAALLTSALARAQIGGFTGDVLGACAVAVECAGLTAVACCR
ncbi:MAG: adenosylcobinamide-GDP ribazoletransferase [Acetobacteraceae bacterium]|nr:adenosylcobinamide-GDP ribazoletransferase [Acetobacteraceae bacterium]